MVEQFREFIRNNGLLDPGDPVVVGFSGGADSHCLLHLLASEGHPIIAAHLHHGQRSEADDDERFCRAASEKLGARFVCERVDVPKFAAVEKIGIEEAGRISRQKFLCQVAEQAECQKIAVGHTLDDNIETVFFNLARGTGLRGLVGMSALRGKLIRPLLFARRRDTESYCETHGLDFIHDSTNFNPQYSRVRTRANLIPAFESIHDGAAENCSRTIAILREENEWLDSVALELIRTAKLAASHPLDFLTTDSPRLSAESLRKHPVGAIRRALYLLGNGAFEFSHLETLALKIKNCGKHSVTSEGGRHHFQCDANHVALLNSDADVLEEIALGWPGETRFENLNMTIRATTVEPQQPVSRDLLNVLIDAGGVNQPVIARPFTPGDRIRPFGADTPRKLQDLLTNAKVTQMMKSRLPVLCDQSGPFWVPGVALDQRVGVSHETQTAFRLVFGPISEPPPV